MSKSYSGPIVTELQAREFLVNAFEKLDVSNWIEEQKTEILDDQLLLHALNRQDSPEKSDLDQQLSDYRLAGVEEAEESKVEDGSDEASEDCSSTTPPRHWVRDFVSRWHCGCSPGRGRNGCPSVCP